MYLLIKNINNYKKNVFFFNIDYILFNLINIIIVKLIKYWFFKEKYLSLSWLFIKFASKYTFIVVIDYNIIYC